MVVLDGVGIDSNLTTKLESTGSNRRWTCEVTDGSQVKTSYSYTEPDVTPDDPQTTTPRRDDVGEPDVTPDDPQTTTPRRDDVGGDQGDDHNDKKTTGPVSIITRAVVSVAVFVALAVLVTYKTRPECGPAAEQHEADKETSEADRVCDSILEKRAEGSADAAADTLST
ncbi:hypothetical protein GN956_G25913 [Arapaima gigas]